MPTDKEMLDWLERCRVAGAYVNIDGRGAGIRYDRSLPDISVRDAIKEAMEEWGEVYADD